MGVAVGQTLTGTASALPPLPARDGIPDWDEVGQLIRSWKVTSCLVGLPLNMDGSDSELSQRARKFARRLEGRFQLPCELIDERLSTREAREVSRASAARHGRRHDPRAQVDSIAAQLLLESWLSEHPQPSE